MTFKTLSYYLYDAKATIKCPHAPFCKHTLNSKVNNWGTEIMSMSHVTFIHITGIKNILADRILHFRCIALYDSLDPEGEGKEF